MQIGMIGIGRMGGDMVRRLLGKGHQCVVYGRRPEAVAPLVAEGAVGTTTYADFVAGLETPRVVWLMVPAATVDAVLQITGQTELLDANPLLKRSIRNRFPYLDPLNHVQVELLRRHRDAAEANGIDERIRLGIHISINGIAAGLRNSG